MRQEFNRTEKADHVTSLLKTCAEAGNIPLKLRH